MWCLPLTLPLVGGVEDEEHHSPVAMKVPAFLFTQHSLTLSWQGVPCYSLVRVNVSSSRLSLCWYKSRATVCCGDAVAVVVVFAVEWLFKNVLSC